MEEGEELLWSVKELSAVRGSGLVGALVGCLPRAPRQNTRLGRPLLLRAEEIQIIREEHLQLQTQTPGEEHLQLQTQTPREEHLAWGSDSELTVFLCWINPDRVSEAELASRLSSLEQSFLFPRSALTVQLSTCRQGLPCSQSGPIRGQDLPLEPIRSEQQSPEPMGVRLQVFRDLRRRGFYLTSGGKFGVDFLVYPGQSHDCFYFIYMFLHLRRTFTVLLSCVRLSSNVKKTLLLCSVSPPGGVLYSSLQWSHMS
uniref:tRNA-intron lyase n=1 Tax=Neogobius melanostomus TaxID=47308 RepID=A0A8C6SEB0_9GOBI